MKTFLDLEGTVIDVFSDCCTFFIPLKVSEHIATNNVTEVSIFSFAVWNENCKSKFESSMRKELEHLLGVKIMPVMSVDDLRFFHAKNRGVCFDSTHDFISNMTKQRAFFEFCESSFDNETCVLFDDVVTNATLHFPDRNLTVKTIRV